MRKTLLCFLIFHTLTAFAQQPADPFARAIEAHGGSGLSVVQTLKIRGQSSDGVTAQPIAISAALDGKLRLEYGQPVNRIEICTSEGTVNVRGGKTSWSTHAGAYSQLDLLSVLGIQHLALGIEKTALLPTTVNGRAASSVRVATGRGKTFYRRLVKDEAEVSFDSETGLVAAISRLQYADESLDLAFTMTTTFSDYRTVDGFVLPFRIGRFVNGRTLEMITVESIEFNLAFAPETFGR